MGGDSYFSNANKVPLAPFNRNEFGATAGGPFASPPNLVRLSPGIESADDLVELDEVSR